MNIIIEGPEASGKTTLAETILAKYPYFEYNHATSKTPNDYKYHKDLLDKGFSLCDRFCVGEMVYPKIYNRNPKLTSAEVHSLFKQCKENNDIFVILYSSDINVLKKRLIARGENNFLDEIEEQNRLFLINSWDLSVYDYDRYFVVDISKPYAYDILYQSIFKILDGSEHIGTTNYVYRQVCRDLLTKGHNVDTSKTVRGTSKELNNYSFTIKYAEDNVISLKSRDTSYSYLAGEMLWYWEGRNDLNFISNFSSFWNRISDDGKTANSAYGYILQNKHGFNQIEKIIELLKKDPSSRRAVLNINVPNENVIETKDEMCTICLIFFIRENKLYCTSIMRSQDVVFGLTFDAVYFMQLQKYIAKRLNVELGDYTHFTTSIHFYDRDYDLIRRIASSDLQITSDELLVDRLIDNSKELANYVDESFTSKEDFIQLLRDKNILRKREINESSSN
jgi:thymidylate synthase